MWTLCFSTAFSTARTEWWIFGLWHHVEAFAPDETEMEKWPFFLTPAPQPQPNRHWLMLACWVLRRSIRLEHVHTLCSWFGAQTWNFMQNIFKTADTGRAKRMCRHTPHLQFKSLTCASARKCICVLANVCFWPFEAVRWGEDPAGVNQSCSTNQPPVSSRASQTDGGLPWPAPPETNTNSQICTRTGAYEQTRKLKVQNSH